jgi:hypothetical protein
MKSINPNADYLKLQQANACEYSPCDFKNDLGQRIKFYEDPTLGDDSAVWVAFPEHGVAFLSDFFETDDMTAKVGNVFSAEVCIKNGWSTDEDMDYVPRLIDGEMWLKFETE